MEYNYNLLTTIELLRSSYDDHHNIINIKTISLTYNLLLLL